MDSNSSNIVRLFFLHPFLIHLTISVGWANNTTFPPKNGLVSGFDPIIGQASGSSSRTITGTNPNQQSETLNLPTEWVVPRGGEYFFSPSISALRDTFALGVHIQ